MVRGKDKLEESVPRMKDTTSQFANMSELEANHPEWHATMVETENHLRTAVCGLFPVMMNMKNSWSNNFRAKVAWKHKYDVAAKVATLLMDGVMVLHGVARKEAVTNMYQLVRPRVSRRWLSEGDKEVVQKIFGHFSGVGIKVEELEADFLAKNPEYAQGTKHKRDAKEDTATVIVKGLTDNIPAGFVANKELQARVHDRFVAFTTAIKEEVAEARMGEINGFQVDSIVVGSLVHQYFGKETFGGGM